MASLTLRNNKGSPLTNQEGDDNLSNLLVAIGGTNAAPYTLPVPSGTGSPVLTSGPTIDTPRITSELRINNTANTYYVGFKAGSLSANKIWTLPALDGAANQVLKTDGSGNLGWITAGSTGNMNVVQTVGTRTVVLSSATFPYTVVSVNITTSGGPVLVTVYGDAENVTASSWGRLALYRGATKLGTEVQFEANGASENCPYSCIVVDNPAAGTYTYSMKITTLAGSNFNFGELEGPVITATELTGAVGPQGPAGSGGGGTVTSVSALTLGTTGTDVSSSVANSTSTPVITLNIPTASVTNRGALSSTDWSTFNNKQDALVSGTNIKTINGTSLLGSTDITVTGGLVPTAIKTANGYTASANDLVRCNTTSGGFSVTLPASPTDGATIGFLDMAGTFATSNLTVLPNTGKTIESDSTSYILDINGTSVSFVYNLASTNWRLLQTPSVPATAVLSTGKAIAMSIVFGG